MGDCKVIQGDSRDVLKTLADGSIDSVVTDPPYALVSIVKRFGKPGSAPAKGDVYKRASAGFMSQTWDTGETAFDAEFWREVYRVLKPGAHVVAFSGTRTYHRLACAIEDAGFEIRDMVAWLYGSGFPKSHDVSKSITKRTDPNKVREIKDWLAEQFAASGKSKSQINRECGFTASDYLKTEAGNDAGGRATWHMLLPHGAKWAKLRAVVGFGAAYDEEIERLGVIAGRRAQPKATKEIYGKFSGIVTDFNLTEAAQQWEGWGTALKPALEPIVFARKPLAGTVAANVLEHGTGALNIGGCRIDADWANDPSSRGFGTGFNREGYSKAGAVANAPGVTTAWEPTKGRWPANVAHDGSDEVLNAFPHTTSGLFTGARSSDKFRSTYGAFKGTPEGETETYGDSGSAARFFYTAKADAEDRLGSKHPTVKPIDLMAWLCRLVTPPGGLVLDPFAGTGTTGLAAMREGFSAILIEREEQYVADINRRLAWARGEGRLTAQETARAEPKTVDDLPLFGALEA